MTGDADPERRGVLRRRVLFAVGWIAVLAAAAWVFRHPEVVAPLASVGPQEIALLLLLSVAALFANGLSFRALLQAAGIRPSFVEWFGLSTTNTMYNMLLPAKPGLLARGYYLNRRHGLAPVPFAALTAAGSWFALLAAALMLLGGLALVGRQDGGPPLLPFAAGIIVLLAVASVASLAVNPGWLRSRKGRAAALASEFVAGIRSLSERPWDAVAVVVHSAAMLAFSAWRLRASCEAVGHVPSWGAALVATALVVLSTVVSITPGNLGIKEGITAFCAGLLGMDAESALLASLVDRAASTAATLAAGAVFHHLLVREMTKESGPRSP